MESNPVALEDAIIELGKVQSFLHLIDARITGAPSVKEAQDAYFLMAEIFTRKYNDLKKAFYGEDVEND